MPHQSQVVKPKRAVLMGLFDLLVEFLCNDWMHVGKRRHFVEIVLVFPRLKFYKR